MRCPLRSPTLRVECLEDRSVPATLDVSGSVFAQNGFGGGNFTPFPGFTGSVRTASGDVNGDGVPDIIAAQGTGTGSGSRVRIFDGASARFGSRAVVISDFYAYSNVAGAGQTPGFGGGVFVASGDLNGDGLAEVIVSPGVDASGHLKVFDFNGGSAGFLGSNPKLAASFFAYPGFLGEVRVTTMNQTNGQSPLLVTASGAGVGSSDVRLYSNAASIGQVASGTFVSPLAQTFPFPGFTNGVSVAGGNANQLFVGTNRGSAVVSAFNLTATSAGGFTLSPGLTFQPTFGSQTDIRLSSADLNGDGRVDVLTSFPGSNVSGIQAFSLAGGTATTLNGFNSSTGTNFLNSFQGFGMFGNTWLASSTFTGTSLIGPNTNQGLSFTNTQGLNGTNGNAVFFNSGANGAVLSPGVR